MNRTDQSAPDGMRSSGRLSLVCQSSKHVNIYIFLHLSYNISDITRHFYVFTYSNHVLQRSSEIRQDKTEESPHWSRKLNGHMILSCCYVDRLTADSIRYMDRGNPEAGNIVFVHRLTAAFSNSMNPYCKPTFKQAFHQSSLCGGEISFHLASSDLRGRGTAAGYCSVNVLRTWLETAVEKFYCFMHEMSSFQT